MKNFFGKYEEINSLWVCILELDFTQNAYSKQAEKILF